MLSKREKEICDANDEFTILSLVNSIQKIFFCRQNLSTKESKRIKNVAFSQFSNHFSNKESPRGIVAQNGPSKNKSFEDSSISQSISENKVNNGVKLVEAHEAITFENKTYPPNTNSQLFPKR